MRRDTGFLEEIVREISSLTRREMLAGTAAAATSMLLAGGAARAQAAYPTRPVRVIVPYPPAGGADTVSRLLFQKLGEMWGQ
jgi:tripartite-type tricarboxylate transporter receptor subunit TctC